MYVVDSLFEMCEFKNIERFSGVAIVWRECANFFNNFLPARGERIVMLIVGTISGWLSFAVGGFDLSIKWLFAFTVADYLTGTIAAFKNQEWCSSVGGRGIVKKVLIFAIVSIGHGIDQTCGIDIFRNAIIAAYAVNESGSILENLETLGYGSLIPQSLRRGLKILKDKEENLFKEHDIKERGEQ